MASESADTLDAKNVVPDMLDESPVADSDWLVSLNSGSIHTSGPDYGCLRDELKTESIIESSGEGPRR